MSRHEDAAKAIIMWCGLPELMDCHNKPDPEAVKSLVEILAKQYPEVPV